MVDIDEAPAQSKVLWYCWEYYKRNDNLPTIAQICDYCEYASPNAAHACVEKLIWRGYLEKSENPSKVKFTAKARRYFNEN